MFFLHSLLFPSLPTMCLFFRPAAAHAWILFSDRSNILPFHSTARRSRERIATQCHDQRRVLKRPFWNVGLNHMWLDKYSLLRTGRITCGRQMETVKFNMRDGVGLQQTASGRWSVENGTKSDKSRFVVETVDDISAEIFAQFAPRRRWWRNKTSGKGLIDSAAPSGVGNRLLLRKDQPKNIQSASWFICAVPGSTLWGHNMITNRETQLG